MRKLYFVLSAFSLSALGLADFSYNDFSSVSGLQLNGTAFQNGNDVRMTVDQLQGQSGNMWRNAQESVANGFSTTFQFRCDGQGDLPADGMAFGIQGTSDSELGWGGSENSMGGLPGCVYVNFQSFWNSVQIVGVDTGGNTVYAVANPIGPLHRAEPWTAKIDYDGVSKDWTVSLENTVVLTGNFDLSGAVALNGTDAYVGLGAGTGLGYDNNDALSWNMQTVPEPCSLLAVGIGGALAWRRKRGR